MSPELERLLEALYERDTCEPAHRPKWHAVVERLIADALSKQPGISHDQLMAALHSRYVQFRRAHRKPSTLPPSA